MVETPSAFLARSISKALGLAAIERRRRLVHDHQAGILGENLEDFDELALIGRQIADNRIRLQPFASHAVKQRDQSRRFGLQRLAVDKDATFRLAAEENIVGDGKLRNEAELLIKQRNTGIFGVRGLLKRTSSPLNLIAPLVGATAPATILQSVLLPQPLAPSNA